MKVIKYHGFNTLNGIAMQKRKGERKHKRWIEVLKLLVTMLSIITLLVSVGASAIKSRYESKVEKEINRKRRIERNKSRRERELDMAK